MLSTQNTMKNFTIGIPGTVTDPNRKIRMIVILSTQNTVTIVTIDILGTVTDPK